MDIKTCSDSYSIIIALANRGLHSYGSDYRPRTKGLTWEPIFRDCVATFSSVHRWVICKLSAARKIFGLGPIASGAVYNAREAGSNLYPLTFTHSPYNQLSTFLTDAYHNERCMFSALFPGTRSLTYITQTIQAIVNEGCGQASCGCGDSCVPSVLSHKFVSLIKVHVLAAAALQASASAKHLDQRPECIQASLQRSYQ